MLTCLLASSIVSLILRIPEEVSYYLFLTLHNNLWWQVPQANYLLDYFWLYLCFLLFGAYKVRDEKQNSFLAFSMPCFFLMSSLVNVFLFFTEISLSYPVDVWLLMCSKHTSVWLEINSLKTGWLEIACTVMGRHNYMEWMSFPGCSNSLFFAFIAYQVEAFIEVTAVSFWLELLRIQLLIKRN